MARRFDEVAIAGLEAVVGVMVGRAFGPKKKGMAYNYAGQRCGRAHPAVWAEAGRGARR